MRPKISLRTLMRDEQGVALVLAILITLVLLIPLSSVIFLTAAGARDVQQPNAGQSASNNKLSITQFGGG